MNKIIYILIGIVTFFSFSIFAGAVESKSSNAVMYNLNDTEIIYDKNKDDKVKIASLTKIMTILVAFEEIEDLDKEVTINKKMLEGTSGYAVAGFEVGDKVKYKDLIYAAYLGSAADAVNAIVISVSKDEERFVNLMNAEAKDLKLEDTKFNNTIGKDSRNNYSTVNDLAKLTIYSLKNEDFKEMWETKEYKINDDIELKNTIYNKVDKLKDEKFKTDYITGAKAGYTDKAKYCLVSTAKIDGVEYLLVTVDNESDKDYTAVDAVDLYKYYSENYSYKTILSIGQKITTIKVKNSPKKINILSPNNVKKYLSNEIDLDKLEYQYTGKTDIKKNTPTGTTLGVLKIKNGTDVLYKQDVKLNEAIGFVFSYYYLIHIGVFLILCVLIMHIKKKSNYKNF